MVALPALAFSCAENLGENHCEDPGSSEKWECPGGRTSVRTCDAFNTWGACYCSEPGPVCGDGEVEGGEQCDDGNTDDGDGCSSGCVVETTVGPGGFGGTPVGTGGTPVGTGGIGGTGGTGGMNVGGAGGAAQGGAGQGGGWRHTDHGR